jgi:hypothetical protein
MIYYYFLKGMPRFLDIRYTLKLPDLSTPEPFINSPSLPKILRISIGWFPFGVNNTLIPTSGDT